MARPNTLQRANTRTRGRVNRRLRRWHAQGKSSAEMAAALGTTYDVHVDASTVRRHLATLGIAADERGATLLRTLAAFTLLAALAGALATYGPAPMHAPAGGATMLLGCAAVVVGCTALAEWQQRRMARRTVVTLDWHDLRRGDTIDVQVASTGTTRPHRVVRVIDATRVEVERT